MAADSEAGIKVLEDWLHIELENEQSSLRVQVVAWCEAHPTISVLAANGLLWGLILTAMSVGG